MSLQYHSREARIKKATQTETTYASLKIHFFFKRSDFPEYTKHVFSTKYVTSIFTEAYLNSMVRAWVEKKGENFFKGIETYPFDTTTSAAALLS